VCESADGKLVATADDFGAVKVKVYNCPCVSQGNGSVEGKGHSSHVTNVRFQQGDGYMI
jgi:microtubule-associated protein-like 6